MGKYFAQKQAHMVTCAMEDIFQAWMKIIKDVEQGILLVKKANQTLLVDWQDCKRQILECYKMRSN